MDDLHPLLRRANQGVMKQPAGTNQAAQPMTVDDRMAERQLREKNTGFVPYMTNAVNGINRGMTQAAELPYNVVNNAPRLMNLLPGEQGMGSLDEMGVPGFKDLGKDPVIDFVGKHYPGMQQIGGINQPNPEYPITNRVTEDIGTGVGVMGAGALASGANGLAGVLAKFLGKPLMTNPVAAVAGETAASLGAAGGRAVADEYDVENPVGRFALEMAGSMTPSGVTDMVGAGGKKLISREGSDVTLGAMDRLKMRPSIGLTGNQNAATLENAAAILPFFGSVAKNVQTGQIDEFGNIVKTAASKVRPTGAISKADDMLIGEQIHDIATSGLGRMKSGFGQREDALMATIGKDTPINISNVRKTFTDQLKYATGATKSALQRELNALDEVADAAGDVPAQSLRNWRSNFGAGIEDQGLLKGAKSQVYKSVTEDLQGAADKAGVGDDFRNLMSEQSRAHNKDIRLSDGGDIPAMESIASSQVEKGKSYFQQSIVNPDRVQMLKRNATPEQWKQFTGDTLEYLGVAKSSAQDAAGEAISPNTFLTNWDKMDNRVKVMLFDDGQGTLETLNDLAIVAEAMRGRGNASNFSNTAGVGMSAGALAKAGAAVGTAGAGTGAGAMVAGLPGAVAGAGITYATVKMLMSQTLARWAAKQGVPLGEKMTTKAITGAAKASNTSEDPEPLRNRVRPSDKNKK